MIKLVSDLRQVGGFLRVLRFPSDRDDITKILLKVALNTIIITLIITLHWILTRLKTSGDNSGAGTTYTSLRVISRICGICASHLILVLYFVFC